MTATARAPQDALVMLVQRASLASQGKLSVMKVVRKAPNESEKEYQKRFASLLKVYARLQVHGQEKEQGKEQEKEQKQEQEKEQETYFLPLEATLRCSSDCALLLPFCGGNLLTPANLATAPLSRAQLLCLARKFELALRALRRCRVLHRNVTLGNVLFDGHRFTLIDYCDAVALADNADLQHRVRGIVGNRLFAAPELRPSFAADWFAAGCVLAVVYLRSAQQQLFAFEQRDSAMAALQRGNLDGTCAQSLCDFWSQFGRQQVEPPERLLDLERRVWRWLSFDESHRMTS